LPINKFEALVVEVEEKTTSEESDILITEAGQLIRQEQAINIVQKLSDRAVTHALIKDNNSQDDTNKCFSID